VGGITGFGEYFQPTPSSHIDITSSAPAGAFAEPATGSRATRQGMDGILVAIHTLADVAQNNSNQDTKHWAAEALGRIGATSVIARDALIALIYDADDESVRASATRNLYRVDRGTDEAIAAWMHLLHYETNYYIRYPIIDFLKMLAVDNQQVIAELKEMLRAPGNDQANTRKLAQMGLMAVNCNLGAQSLKQEDNVGLFLAALKTAPTIEDKETLVYSLPEIDSSRIDEMISAFLEILEAPEINALAGEGNATKTGLVAIIACWSGLGMISVAWVKVAWANLTALLNQVVPVGACRAC
jgi:hypothetical protein